MPRKLTIALIEPFYAGSHKYWADRLTQLLDARVVLFSLPGRHWKWRMSSACVFLSEKVNTSNEDFDVFLVTDMLDVAAFKGLLNPVKSKLPVALYMHENQIVYPFQTPLELQQRDRQYGWINFKSVLASDVVWFNSDFHKEVFYERLPNFLQPFPESATLIKRIPECVKKSQVVPLGIDAHDLDQVKVSRSKRPVVLWNHRWEHDKNPELFFSTLIELFDEGVDFELVVCGEHFGKHPKIFDIAKSKLSTVIRHWGYFESREEYVHALWQCTVLPVSSNQEFFGLSVLEAVYCGVQPILPNRLSYPSLYDDRSIFYETNEEFKAQLRESLLKGEPSDYRHLAEQFSWEKVIPVYMDALAKVSA
ncbi:MAG: DUF3524 domain-containing protein [Bacteroidia bacterium]|nr:DUF3524 domain-containing protein [Bacteroidia bacterium]